MSVPAAVTDPVLSRSDRAFTAFLCLVSRQNASGGRGRLSRVFRTGDGDLAKPMVVRATSAIRRLSTDQAGQDSLDCGRSHERDGLIATWFVNAIRATGHQCRPRRPDRQPHPDRSQHQTRFTPAAKGRFTNDSASSDALKEYSIALEN